MNLFQAAAINASSLERRLDDLLGGFRKGKSDALERFLEHVDTLGKVSINLRMSTLLTFLVEARYQNIYEWACGQAEWSSKDPESLLQERLDVWYERRVAFDRAFDNGEQFRYGALNSGGLGPRKYGSFCMTVGSMPPSNWSDLAFLPSDSLATYVDASGAINRAGIQRDVGLHSHRKHVAGLKHDSALDTMAEADWPRIVCSDEGYIEAVFIGDLTPVDIACVRMPRKEFELYYDYAFVDATSKLSEPERVLIETFRLILRQLKSRGIRLEVV